MDGDRRSSRRRGPSRYCSNCGAGLEPSMNYCPDCGSPTDAEPTRSGPTSRPVRNGSPTDTGSDREMLEHRIARASRDGWELEHDFGDRAVMVRRTFGSVDEHLAVALVTVWFTMGIGNALWGAYRYFGDAERMILRAERADGTGTADAADGATGSGLLWRATAGVCWLVAAVVALLGLEIATGTASLVLFALAALVATLGVSALPSVRRRLEGRRSIAANGRVRSVSERDVTAPGRPCAACAEPIGRGIERTYRRAFCVLGVPLTAEEGRNYYCRRCATAETPAGGTTARAESAEPTTEPSATESTVDREPEPDRT